MPDHSTAPAPSSETLVDIYRRMIRIERNDDTIRTAIRRGKLVMPYYSARGQEVIPSAISTLLSDDDTICTIYRGIHDMVAKGMPLRPLWAEVAGRVDGTCKGKGGPMHLTHPETGVMVTTGIVGSSMPIANGLAWAAQLDGSKRVSIAYFGDGASNIGAFHESLNLASLWKLPVVFVCQNNGFAEHSRYELGTSVDRISKRAAGYGMPGYTVDGNDPWAMYAAAHEAINRARDGEGPTLLECKTFRFHGHVLGDDDKYMTKGEKAAAIADDPLPKFRARLIAEGHASEEQLTQMAADIQAEVDDAMAFGLASEPPSVDELRRDVFEQEMAAWSEMVKMHAFQAVNAALHEAMEADPKVLVLGEDIGDAEGGGVTGACVGLSTKFGTARVKSTPISEQAIVGAAIGAALAGYKPVAEIMLMNFTTVCMDMIFNHAAKLRFMSGGQSTVPITIRTLTGAGWQTAGQHADHLEGWFAHAAGIKVVAPSNPADYKGLLLSCIQDPDPCIIIESAGTLFIPHDVKADQGPIPLGVAKVVQEGSDVTIVSWSSMVVRSQMALAALADKGISVELIDLRTISPWDRETVLASVARTGRCVVVHEALRSFGPGAEIAATVNEELFGKLKAPVRRLGAPECPVPFAKVLEDAFLVSVDEIVATVEDVAGQG